MSPPINGGKDMGLSITNSKTKAAFHTKTKAVKKYHEHQVSLAAMAATQPAVIAPSMKVEQRNLEDMKGLPKRARKSSQPQIERVAASLKRFAQSAPILINSNHEIINGHIVAQALRKLGRQTAWCVVIDHLDETEQAALHIALNKLQEGGEWDLDALGPIMLELEELGFDLGTTGFSLPEIDIITSSTPNDSDAGTAQPVEDLDPPSVPVSHPGDLWVLGKHRLLCGDATQAASYEAVLEGQLADGVFTDAPWNIPIAGFVSGLGKTKHEDFLQGAGELSEEEFRAFCAAFHQLCHDHMAEGAAMYSCIDWRSVDIVMDAGRKAGLQHINTAVWNKGSGGMGMHRGRVPRAVRHYHRVAIAPFIRGTPKPCRRDHRLSWHR